MIVPKKSNEVLCYLLSELVSSVDTDSMHANTDLLNATLSYSVDMLWRFRCPLINHD